MAELRILHAEDIKEMFLLAWERAKCKAKVEKIHIIQDPRVYVIANSCFVKVQVGHNIEIEGSLRIRECEAEDFYRAVELFKEQLTLYTNDFTYIEAYKDYHFGNVIFIPSKEIQIIK